MESAGFCVFSVIRGFWISFVFNCIVQKLNESIAVPRICIFKIIEDLYKFVFFFFHIHASYGHFYEILQKYPHTFIISPNRIIIPDEIYFNHQIARERIELANLSLKHVKKVYPGNVTAVRDFNLDIEDKEFIVLVGPSGCGKTTTLRMIAGLEEITEGELYIGDRLVNDVAPKDRDIAMVFQNYALYPHMTVYDNMAFGLKLKKVPKAEIDERVRKAAKILEIEPLLDRRPKALSGGQRQRVALGRAMVREPKVFLMDEPLSNLDAKLRVQMRTEIAKLHKRLNTTFIYVTHDQTEAMTMGTRIVIMKDGDIQQIDNPQKAYDKPANLFVAGFIGEPPMNFLPSTATSQGGDVVLRATDGSFSVKLPPELAHKVKSHNSDQIEIGIRPINIMAAHHPNGNGAVEVEASVFTFEALGEEGQLAATVGEQQVLVVTPATEHFERGNKVWLEMQTKRLHLFDAETGLAL